MKNLTRKLFLSICTLAICAVTLVSTTFAWYTTNTEVSVDGVKGTASTSGDASIYVSWNGTDWAQSIDLTEIISGAKGEQYKTGHSLVPLQLKADGLYNLAGTKDASKESVVTFTLYFKTAKTDKNIPLYIQNIDLVNPNSLTPVDNLLYLSSDKMMQANPENPEEQIQVNKPNVGVNRQVSTYAVDIVKALGMTTVECNATDLTPITGGKALNIDLENLASPKADIEVTNANAVNYYNEVMKASISETGTVGLTQIKEDAGQRSQIATLPQNGDAEAVTFTIFINGWDEYCYDAIKGQTFNFDIQFTTVNTTSSN